MKSTLERLLDFKKELRGFLQGKVDHPCCTKYNLLRPTVTKKPGKLGSQGGNLVTY